MSQTVLITGASNGFGLLTARTLLAAGHTVAASMRDPENRNKAAADELGSKGAYIVNIDVTDDAGVETGVARAIKLAGNIDVVINNAGAGALGLQEAFTIDDWKTLFDLNVFGVQRMNRAILPHMRSRGSGLLIHISSLLGRFVIPFMGPYNASKHALEALADNYRVELAPLGIESIIVEPGGYGTDFGPNALKAGDKDRIKSYGDMSDAPEKMMGEFGKNFEGDDAPSPQMVADAVLRVIELPRGQRPFRTVVDGLGMGDPIEKYNLAADQTTKGIYTAFGMDSMLKVKMS